MNSFTKTLVILANILSFNHICGMKLKEVTSNTPEEIYQTIDSQLSNCNLVRLIMGIDQSAETTEGYINYAHKANPTRFDYDNDTFVFLDLYNRSVKKLADQSDHRSEYFTAILHKDGEKAITPQFIKDLLAVQHGTIICKFIMTLADAALQKIKVNK